MSFFILWDFFEHKSFDALDFPFHCVVLDTPKTGWRNLTFPWHVRLCKVLVDDLTRVDVIQYRSFNVVVILVSPCALAAVARVNFFCLATGFLKRRAPTFLLSRARGGGSVSD